jgi:DNA polymerase III subunit epsilon
MYAVVDIETTGGNASHGKVIEVAIVVHDGTQIVERYSSLVNPGRNIPPFITMLTGITNQMVADAPHFEEIAVKVHRMTEGKVFVAHNVSFDFSFIKNEFSAIGVDFDRKKLCTVRLSRKLVPGLKKYNLGSICGHLKIPIHGRHRALGDAEATAHLLTQLLQKDTSTEVVKHSLKRSSKEMSLPPHISREMYDKLPSKQGVYYFHDQNGQVVYVGKAVDIKDRVGQHFSGNTHTKTKTMFKSNIYDVSYTVTGNELISLLLENEDIKKHYPRYNRANKTFQLNFGLYTYEDQLGFTRIVMGKAGKRDKPFVAFGSEAEALHHVLTKVKEHGLCLRLCGVIKSNEMCQYEHQNGQACPVCKGDASVKEYNHRVKEAFSGTAGQHTFLIKTQGRKQDEQGFVLVEKGRFLGFGYVEQDTSVGGIEDLKSYLHPCYDTQDSQTIIKAYLKKSRLLMENPMKVYSFS